MINIGIIGVGSWGKNYLKTIKNHKDIKLMSYFSTGNVKNISYMQSNYPNVARMKSLKELIYEKNIDAIIIASPTKTHFDIVLKCLENNKHVLVEKPPAQNNVDFNKLIVASQKAKSILLVNNIYLYDPAYMKLEDKLKGEKIKSVFSEWKKFGSFKGNILWELVYHDIYLTQKIAGKIKKIKINYKKGLFTNCDIISLEGSTEYGIAIKIKVNRIYPFKNKSLHIICDKRIFLLQNGKIFQKEKDDKNFQKVYSRNAMPLNLVIDDFIKKILKKDYIIDHTLTLNTIKITESLQ